MTTNYTDLVAMVLDAYEAMNAPPVALAYEYGEMMNNPEHLRHNLIELDIDTTPLDMEIN